MLPTCHNSAKIPVLHDCGCVDLYAWSWNLIGYMQRAVIICPQHEKTETGNRLIHLPSGIEKYTDSGHPQVCIYSSTGLIRFMNGRHKYKHV